MLTAEDRDDIADKINAEGFDYYFADYGADKKLNSLIGSTIERYIAARSTLITALRELDIEVDL